MKATPVGNLFVSAESRWLRISKPVIDLDWQPGPHQTRGISESIAEHRGRLYRRLQGWDRAEYFVEAQS